MPGNGPDDQNNYRYKEDNDGDPVHAVHEEDIDIARLIGVAFFQE